MRDTLLTIIDEFQRYRKATCSRATLKVDAYACKHLAEYLREQPADTPARELLLGYLAHLRSHTEWSEGTKASVSERLYAMLRWAVDEGYLSAMPLRSRERYRRPEPNPQPLTPDEVRRILAACSDTCWWHMRDRAIVITALETGCRRGELLQMRVSDLQRGYSQVRQKGDRLHTLILTSAAQDAIQRYLDAYHHADNRGAPPLMPADLLWRGVNGKPLTGDQLRKTMRRLSARAGVDVWIHRLRATSATWRLALGASTEVVRAALGHTSERALRHYARLAHEQLQPLLEATSPAQLLEQTSPLNSRKRR